MRAAAKFYKRSSTTKPRFFAFDSFRGLSNPEPRFDGNMYSSGQYQCSLNRFKSNIQRVAQKWEVNICQGYYDKTLQPSLRSKHQLTKAAFIMIDCDLYEPTLQALRFVTPILQTGTVIYFDDWFFCRGSMTHGEPAACAEWLSDNPQIQLIEFGNSAVMSKYFIVNIKNS